MMSWLRNHSWLCSPASPITVAPVLRASWDATDPTPPAAADTTTVSLGRGATASTQAYPAIPTTNSEPATSQDSGPGLAVSWSAGTSTNSAWLARVSVQPSTSSPTANPVTPSPIAWTTPARSVPWPDGNVAG